MLRYNVHCHFAEEQICADTGCCCDSGGLNDIQNDLHGKVVGRELIGIQIIGHIHEHLVDGIDNYVLRGDVFHVDFINSRAVLHVICHSRRRDDKVNRKRRIGLQLGEEL